MFGPGGVGGDERQRNLGLRHRAQFDLGLLGRLEEPLQGLRIVAQVDAVVPLELVGQVVDQPAVEVVTAQVAVTGGGANLDHPVADVQDADVEGAATEVEHQHRFVPALVQAVGQRRGGRFVDDPQHFEPGDPPGVLGRGALRVIEVGGHRDDGLGDPFAERLARIVGELAQHQGADLLGRVLLAPDLEPGQPVVAFDDVEGDRLRFAGHLVVAAADEPLRRVDGPLRVQDRLAARQLPHQPLPGIGEGDHGRRGPRAFGVRDHIGFAAFPGRDHRVRRPQIDADCLSHE